MGRESRDIGIPGRDDAAVMSKRSLEDEDQASPRGGGGQRLPAWWATRPHPPVRLWIVVMAVLAPIVWTSLVLNQAVGDGTVTYPRDPPTWSARGVILAEVVEPKDRLQPLKPGYCVQAVNDIQLEDWTAHRTSGSAPTEGAETTYSGLRPPTDDDDPSCAQGTAFTVSVVLGGYPAAEMIREHLIAAVLPFFMLAIGIFVYLHRPRDPAARALFLLGALLPYGATAWPFGPQVIDVVHGRFWPYLVGDVVYAVTWGALLHFTLVFPEPSRFVVRHRWLRFAVFVLPIALYPIYVAANLPGASGVLERMATVLTPSIAAAWVGPPLVAAILVVNYRATSDPLTKERMRWVLYTFSAAAVAYLGLGQIPVLLGGGPLVPWDLLLLALVPGPIAIAATILRYGLFDIQVVIKRSLVYGGLTVVAVGIYFVVFRLIAIPFGEDGAPLIATAIAAIAVQPLRSWLERAVSRLLYGTRDDPAELIGRLSRRIETSSSMESVPGAVVETLVQALRLAYARIELDLPDGTVEITEHGTSVGSEVTVPLIHRGEDVGRLVLDVGRLREPFGAADRRLLDALARQVGVTAHNVILTRQLQRSLERVVTAREEERRRLRRDLHDGLGPTLAAESMQIEVARQLVLRDPDRATEMLGQLLATQQSVIADLRRLVEGLRPPVLDQLGLVHALRQHAEQFGFASQGVSTCAVTIETTSDIEPLPAAVEVAAYHICLEALANAVRHSGASTCSVRLWRDDGALIVQIEDDGSGIRAERRPGVGLASMRERASEVGGAFTVAPASNGGTLISAALPIAGAAEPTG